MGISAVARECSEKADDNLTGDEPAASAERAALPVAVSRPLCENAPLSNLRYGGIFLASASSRYNVICLAIDRLHAAYLGAYGNTWINTPALDRLAAESLLLDRAVIDSPQLEIIYRSLWQGLHAMVPAAQALRHTLLPQQLTQAGWQTVLLSDDTAVAEHPLATAFADRVVLKPSKAHRSVAGALEETNAAEFFAAASDQLQRLKSPFFLWLHTGTLGNIWDAPLELREQYRDEDDPPAKDGCEVPNQLLPERFDPDELLSITHAYAGQVTLLDELVGSLIASIEEAGLAQNTLLVLLSPRGFPLGEHRRVGGCDDPLYAELTHVPMMLRLPDGLGACRSFRGAGAAGRSRCDHSSLDGTEF